MSYSPKLQSFFSVNPTHVGMNRYTGTGRFGESSKPHACGDEPHLIDGNRQPIAVNPTHVGMNRRTVRIENATICKPHACGDEP